MTSTATSVTQPFLPTLAEHPALRALVSCWRDPDAPPEVAAAYRARQFRGVARQLPVASFATLTIVAVADLSTDGVADPTLRALWTAFLLGFAGEKLLLWWHFIRREPTGPVPRWAVWALTLGVAAAALQYSVLAVYLFGNFGPAGRVMLTAVAAALIATGGWMFASLPIVGISWVVLLCGGIGAGLAWRHWADYAPMVAMLAFYGLLLVATLLVSSRKFLLGLKAESEIEQQRQLVGLLLHDFEEKASDWLWETDADGHLRHASVRLAEAVGCEPSALLGRSLVGVMQQLVAAAPAREPRGSFEQLEQCLARPLPFADVVVPAASEGLPRWWSFAAKPLLDGAGRFTGWRGVGSDITAAREHALEMARMANSDTLTGLANRHQFQWRLAAHFPPGAPVRPCTLLLLDLDNFKAVNDTLGHAAGDELLCEVARRLQRVMAEGSLLARLGGDEFALLLPGGPGRGAVEALGRQLRSVMLLPWAYADHHIDMRASIGVAFAPADAGAAEDLMKAGDLALYAAKAAGRDALRFYHADLLAQVQRRLSLLTDLRRSLADGDFQVHYQPQVELASGRLAGFEALLRWRHPVRGAVMPADFISLTEESGLIVPLGAWVLQQACRDAAGWPAGLGVAVNVSAVQIERSDVAATVEDALRRSGLPHARLELELTESTLMRDSDAALVLLHALRSAGVRIALDDFGTGFSSLAYLRSFPIDKLKIDRSFVGTLDPAQPATSAIVQAVVQLAQALQLDTTAEGVETETQRQILQRIGCSHAQGYHYARPMDAAATLAFIAAWQGPLASQLARASGQRSHAPARPPGMRLPGSEAERRTLSHSGWARL